MTRCHTGCWSRINRNSPAQFMRTRIRYFHVSAPLAVVPVPGSTNQLHTIVVRPGKTYSVGNNARKRERRARRFA